MPNPELSRNIQEQSVSRRGIVRAVGLALLVGSGKTVIDNISALESTKVIDSSISIKPEEHDQLITIDKEVKGILGFSLGFSLIFLSFRKRNL